MQVVLPEFDGRLIAGHLVQGGGRARSALAFTRRMQAPDPAGVAARRRRGARLGPARPRAAPGAAARADPLRLSGARRPGRLCGRPRHARERLRHSRLLGRAGYDGGARFAAETLMPRAHRRRAAFAVPLAAYRLARRRCPSSAAPTSRPAGARRRPTRRARGEHVPLRAPCGPGTSSSRCSPTAAAAATARRAITTPICRRATPISPSISACASERIDALIHLGTHGTPNGCPARPWRCRRAAGRGSPSARCRSSIPSSSTIPARRRRPSAGSAP